MTAERDELREMIDHLYGLPLEEFTPARDAAGKERRSVKDRDGAETLRRLRKPNLVAWSLNRAQRSDPGAVQRLIEAGVRLQEAQRQLVSGGERGLLRQAAADERTLARQVAERAEAELAAAGHAAGASTQSKLYATLHAAAADAEVRDQLARGRLVRDHELSDLGLGDAARIAAPDAAPAPVAGLAPSPAASEQAQREKQARAVRGRLARARERQAERDEQVEQARVRERDAEGAVKEATRELERARAAVGKATAAAERAAQAVIELQAALDDLR